MSAVQPASIPSLGECRESMVIKDVSPQTGFATFASSPGQGIILPVSAAAPAEERARSFVDNYGKAFGLSGASQLRLFKAAEVDALGLEHVRFQQVHKGVPVVGAEFMVHLKGSRAIVANGHVIADLPDDVIPKLPPDFARFRAQQAMKKYRVDRAQGAQYSEARLQILNRSLLNGQFDRSRLAWFVEATGPTLRELIWIDAQSGAILLHFSQLAEAKSRKVYTAAHTDILPGTLLRSEGQPATGDTDQDNAYNFAGITYDYYLANHGRDSFDNAGAIIVSTAHYCEDECPVFDNAFWDGTQMVYGDGFAAADDVVAHELTHAITERTANLFYYVQSGALNESFSDIFGETVDLTDGVGNDNANVRWKIGEDLSIGAIRDMMSPGLFGNPGKMSDSSLFVCSTTAATDFSDSGGVHTNSSIPNHAFALMVDGGSFTLIIGVLDREPIRTGTVSSTANGALTVFIMAAALFFMDRIRRRRQQGDEGAPS